MVPMGTDRIDTFPVQTIVETIIIIKIQRYMRCIQSVT